MQIKLFKTKEFDQRTSECDHNANESRDIAATPPPP